MCVTGGGKTDLRSVLCGARLLARVSREKPTFSSPKICAAHHRWLKYVGISFAGDSSEAKQKKNDMGGHYGT